VLLIMAFGKKKITQNIAIKPQIRNELEETNLILEFINPTLA